MVLRSIGLALLVLAIGGGTALGERRAPPETKRVQATRKWAYSRLMTAQEFLAQEKFAETLEKLDEMKRNPKKLNDHERALMHQTYGYTYSAQADYAAAVREFEAALATGQLPEQAQLLTRYNIGQLYILTEQYDEGITFIRAWFDQAENPAPQAYMLLANAYAQKEDYAAAVPYARTGIEKSEAPRESWLRLLLALHLELEQYAESLGVLVVLAERFPKKAYWVQLAAVYGELGKEKESLAALEVAYRSGYLTESREIVRLASLYLYHDIPYQAAGILEKGLAEKAVEASAKNWELLANAWIRAQELERSISPLERAAKLSEDGELYLRLAQVHVQNEVWKRAAAALVTALDKGGLKKTGNAHLLLGVARFYSGELEAAKRSFERAARYEETEKSARQWLKQGSLS